MQNKFIILAKIGKPFGLKGFVNLQTYTDTPQSLLDYPALFWKKKTGWQPCQFEASTCAGAQLRVKFADFDTPEATQALTHLLIGAPREALSPLPQDHQTYYWSDLEGLNVITDDQIALGQVQYLMNVGASDLMVIKGEKEHIIPFVMDDIVLAVDLEKKTILINWTTDFQ